jgi:hypothetical protein
MVFVVAVNIDDYVPNPSHTRLRVVVLRAGGHQAHGTRPPHPPISALRHPHHAANRAGQRLFLTKRASIDRRTFHRPSAPTRGQSQSRSNGMCQKCGRSWPTKRADIFCGGTFKWWPPVQGSMYTSKQSHQAHTSSIKRAVAGQSNHESNRTPAYWR